MVLLHRRVVVIQAQLAVAAFITSDVAVLLHRWPHGHRAEQAAAIVQNQFHLRLAIQLRQQGFQARDLRRIGVDTWSYTGHRRPPDRRVADRP